MKKLFCVVLVLVLSLSVLAVPVMAAGSGNEMLTGNANGLYNLKLIVQDKDDPGSCLTGAGFTVYVEDNALVADTVCWDADENCYVIQNLQVGTEYRIKMTTAPSGYLVPDSDAKFEANESGVKMNVNGWIKFRDGGVLCAEVEQNLVPVSVENIRNGAMLPEAVMQVVDDAGTVYDHWRSTMSIHEIRGVPTDTELTLKMTEPPAGFAAPVDVRFQIDSSGGITSAAAGNHDDVLIIWAGVTRTQLSAADKLSGELLPDVCVQILDPYGYVVSEFDSTADITEISELNVETEYTVQVTEVPAGYAIPEEIAFSLDLYGKTVVDGEEVQTVEFLLDRDEAAPEINGVENDAVYYTTQSFTVSDNFDANPDVSGTGVAVNKNADGSYSVPGNVAAETEVTVTAKDYAGNETKVTFTLLPICTLDDAIEGITTENVSSDDENAVQRVRDRIAELLETATGEEKEALEELLGNADDLLDKIDEIIEASNSEELQAISGITKENVQESDREALLAAKEKISEFLSDYDKNLTDEEKAYGETLLDDIDEMIAVLDAAPVQYNVLEGKDGIYTMGSNTGLRFRVDGEFGSFTGISIDGAVVAAENYIASSGSTVVMLKPEYLETLALEVHTITFRYADGEASCGFRLVRVADNTAPNTGDDSHLMLHFTAMTLSLAAAAALLFLRKKAK